MAVYYRLFINEGHEGSYEESLWTFKLIFHKMSTRLLYFVTLYCDFPTPTHPKDNDPVSSTIRAHNPPGKLVESGP